MESQFNLSNCDCDDPYSYYFINPTSKATHFPRIMKYCLMVKKYPEIMDKIKELLPTLTVAEINQKNSLSRTTLMLASNFAETLSSTEVVKLLIEHGADVDAKSFNGSTALILTSKYFTSNSNLETLETLILSCSNINEQNNDGDTALMCACFKTTTIAVDVVRLFLKYGADPNIKNNNGHCALTMVSSGNTQSHLETVRLLLDNGAYVNIQNNFGCTPLSTACCYGCGDITNEIVKLLIERGAFDKQNHEGMTALMFACIDIVNMKKQIIIKTLVEQECNLNIQNNKRRIALMIAMHDIFVKYYQTGDEIIGESIASLLVKSGSNLNLKDNWGNTVLHEMCGYKSATHSCVQLFLEHGSNVNLTNYLGITPLIVVFKKQPNDWYEIAKLLLDYGANINALDRENRSILMNLCSTRRCNKDMILFVLTYNPDLNIQDLFGWTALMLACYNLNSSKIINSLINNGARIDLPNKANETAYDVMLKNPSLKYYSEEMKSKCIDKVVSTMHIITNCDTVCNICSKTSYDLIIVTSCNHAVHKKCLYKFLFENRACPVCQTKLY